MGTSPTPYKELNSVLHELVESIKNILCDNFVGAYLQGSFAVGGFDVHSDVDFIVTTREELSGDQVDTLQTMHERIFNLDSIWAQHLEGSYFPIDVLRDYRCRKDNLWYLDNGHKSLVKSDHCNTIVVRWVLREFGIALDGKPARSLIDKIPKQELQEEIKQCIEVWGKEIIDHPDKYNNQFYQSFIVLSFCRMLNDLYNGYPGSKLSGANWAKANLDPSWHGLIDRTWSGRPNPEVSVVTPANLADYESTLKFVAFIMDEGKKFEISNQPYQAL